MVFDRTIEDVKKAIEIRSTKVKNFQELTDDEISTLEKGSITINTLNRIEKKQMELKSLLNGMGYWNTPIENKEWFDGDIFDITNFQRIIENINILKNAFFTFYGTPSTPTARYYFSNINDLEKILYDIEQVSKISKEQYRRCGNYNCGG